MFDRDDRIHVIHHHPCFDGFTAAWVARSLIERYRDIAFHGRQYGDDLPSIPPGEDVLMVDVSWPRSEMLEFAERVGELVVLDHHKTAEEDLEGLPFAIFDMDRSGAGLAWDYLSDGEPRPLLVDHVEDRDLWRFELEGSKEIHALLSSFDWDFGRWDWAHGMLEAVPDDAYEIGGHIRRYQEQRYDDVANLFHRVRVSDKVIVAANIGLAQFKSGGIHRFLETKAPSWVKIAGAYMRGTDGKWYWSLRARDGHDCSELARKFGGGGHAQAAGFSTALKPEYVGDI